MPSIASDILKAFDSRRTGFCGNGDGFIELRELVCACAPDVDNDRVLDARELELGIQSAKLWVATILEECPQALKDDKISLRELEKIVVPVEKNHPGEEFVRRAEAMLRDISFKNSK